MPRRTLRQEQVENLESILFFHMLLMVLYTFQELCVDDSDFEIDTDSDTDSDMGEFDAAVDEIPNGLSRALCTFSSGYDLPCCEGSKTYIFKWEN